MLRVETDLSRKVKLKAAVESKPNVGFDEPMLQQTNSSFDNPLTRFQAVNDNAVAHQICACWHNSQIVLDNFGVMDNL